MLSGIVIGGLTVKMGCKDVMEHGKKYGRKKVQWKAQKMI